MYEYLKLHFFNFVFNKTVFLFLFLKTYNMHQSEFSTCRFYFQSIVNGRHGMYGFQINFSTSIIAKQHAL